jgi:hypothetical protein
MVKEKAPMIVGAFSFFLAGLYNPHSGIADAY